MNSRYIHTYIGEQVKHPSLSFRSHVCVTQPCTSRELDLSIRSIPTLLPFTFESSPGACKD